MLMLDQRTVDTVNGLHPANDGLIYLVDVGILNRISEYVKCGVKIVEQLDNLHCSSGVRVLGAVVVEADDATEEQCHTLVLLGGHWTLMTKLICH